MKPGILQHMVSSLAAAVCPLALALALAVGAAEVKLVEQAPPAELDAAIAATLQPACVQVSEGGKPSFEFWLCRELGLTAKPESAAKALEAVKGATLLGAVRIRGGQRTYRDHEIYEGVYTLRFLLQPNDGDHLGTAEFPYFAVLVPAKADAKPDAFTTYTPLVKASGRNTPTGHPVVLSLRPSAEGDAPRLLEPAEDHRSVRVKLPAKTPEGAAVTLTFEIVFKGKGKT